MRIEDEIAEWAANRPSWQRAVLRRIAGGEQVGPAEYSAIADRLVEDGWATPEPFSAEHMPRGATASKAVTLLSLGDVEHCNALTAGQTLNFSPTGITVVYGNNGSGKSGYARLIKTLVRARHRQPVLTDIFRDEPSAVQRARVVFGLAGETIEFQWPDATRVELAQVAFYDRACGGAFIARESDVTYRPPALFVMDELIRVCDGVRAEIDGRLKANAAEAEPLPELVDGTAAGKFVGSLCAATTGAQIDAACALAPDVDDQIERALREQQRLASVDPSIEKRRLRDDAVRIRRIAKRLVECDQSLGEDAHTKLVTLRESLATNEAAVALASSKSFDREPLAEVGTAVWRSMWESARKYAATGAYPGLPFPHVSAGARCVLCQTELNAESGSRMARFEAFVRDDGQQKLDVLDRQWTVAVRELNRFEPIDLEVRLATEQLSAEHASVVESCRRALAAFENRRRELVESCAAEGEWQGARTATPQQPRGLVDLAQKLEEASALIDDSTFAEMTRQAAEKRADLEATKKLAESRDVVEREVERLRARDQLENTKRQTATTGISKRASDLTREHTTAMTRDRFTRESDRLRLERVTLEDRGAPKGTLRHMPAFVGAVQAAELAEVLSEGEQTALGLAGFFTDAFLDPSCSAVVLDDPVTSLDHRCRERVAERLVGFAGERQVIVFTHDVSFVVDLRAAAARAKVAFTERAIERAGAGKPGACQSAHPWKARDAAARLEKLGSRLAEIRKQQQDWDEETSERNIAEWAGRLSETWEQLISQEVVGQVIDRGSLEVRPRMFRILARITDEDDTEFQSSYARVSRWAPRHDKAPEVNYTAPTVEEMGEELERVKAWFKRVKGYAK